ncbi:MAG: SRPBCC family protein [Saprospiraceae bacterium]|nr:SRPBCC family protein [Saprospiraceae bacterium]MCB9326542.1 SRPBCC family protein [Lewinellaceae bacterium]
MTTISREIAINATKEEVWKAIAKFGDICHASPGVLKSHVTSQQQEGIGATRHCDFAMNGATAEEKVTAWKEGESLSIEVFELKKMPGINTMKADFAIRTENGKTILRADLNYDMKNAFFDVMNVLMVKKMNIKLWNSVVAGHKKYIETGERVVEKTILELDKVVTLN